MYSVLPSHRTIGVSVSVITYTDDIFVSVTADSAIGEGFGETLLLNIRRQIDQMYGLLRCRRVPKESKFGGVPATMSDTITGQDLSSITVDEVRYRFYG